MGAYFETMLGGLCRLLAPRHMVLAGGRNPALARAMLDAAVQAGATLHIVAERPGDRFAALRRDGGDACVVHDAALAAALSVLPVPGLCWIDADPNWYTTQAALAALEAQATRLGRPFPVTIVEGAGWPHGRRDSYDDPAAIPQAYRLPHERAGLLPGQAMPAGASGLHAGAYHATAENEPGNGVLTAIEDFMEVRAASLRSVVLPGFGGRAGLSPRTGPAEAAWAPEALALYLRATAEALEAVRLQQAVALASAEAGLVRAQTVSALLREAASAQPAPAPPPAPLPPEPAWRTRLRPAVHLARRLARARPGQGAAQAKQEAAQADRLRASPIFDAAWYLAQYPDVAAAGLDPALHYLRSGAAESRDPGPFFGTAAYLAANPDVAEAGINPVLHYLAQGAAEGRALGGSFDAQAYRADHPGLDANPLEHAIAAQRIPGAPE